MNRRILLAALLAPLVGCPNGASTDAGDGTDDSTTNSNADANANANANANTNDNSSGGGGTLDELPLVSPDNDAAPGLTPDVAKPTTAAPPTVAGNTALLNEVRFRPAGDDAPFVELKTTAAAALAGFTLTNENGDVLTLPAGAVTSSKGLLLVLFDGNDSAAPGELHAAAADFLRPIAGRLSLADAAGTLLDQVAWGADQDVDGVALDTGGGLSRDDVPAGLVIARPPDSVLVGPQNWSAYPPAWATPGAANHNAGVSVLLPMSGFVEVSGPILLACYPTANAAEYRFQVSTDAAFAAPQEDITIDEPSVTVMLDAGAYYWRVAAIAADGSTTDFSPANKLIVEDEISTEATPDDGADKPRTRAQPAGGVITTTLDASSPGGSFPSFSQRKDSHMLLLESNRTDAGYEWDRPHPVFHIADFADNMNCSLAAAQMVNHYYGGDLTQDRIGYEMHKNDAPGPETDMNYGEGNTPNRPLAWALGGAQVTPVYGAGAHVNLPPETLWKNVKASIDDGRPVVVAITRRAGGTHTIVIIGYQIDTRHEAAPPAYRFLVNDPGNDGQASAKRSFVEFSHFYYQVYSYYLLAPGAHSGRKQEAGIGADTDKDKVYDFDEKERFHTKWDKDAPTHRDTDGDCISDYNEIKLSVLDEKHGVGVYRTTRRGDGRARAQNAPEITLDTDEGGLPDFVEDLNQNGKIEPDKGESDPFDKADDKRKITGTIKSYKERNRPPILYYRQVDDDLNLHTNTDGTPTGSWKIKIEAKTTTDIGPSPPDCPEARQVISTYNPFEYTAMNVEAEFFCSEGNAPSMQIREKPPNQRHYQHVSHADPCHGPSMGTDSMGWTPMVARGITGVAISELIVARNRVQWKYRIAPTSSIPDEAGSYLEVDITMTPGQ